MPDPTDLTSNDNFLANGIHFASFGRNGKLWRVATTVSNWPEELLLLGANPDSESLKKAAARDIWINWNNSPQPLAVMCSGLGAAWPHMGRELYDNFPVCRNAMDHLAAIADWDLLSLMDEPDLEVINQTRLQIPYLFLLEYAQWSQFKSLGLKPSLMSGHSLGELTALCFAGVYSPETAWHLLDTRAEHIAGMEKNLSREGGMLAVSINPDAVYSLLPEFPEVKIANKNTSAQIILSGSRDDLLKIRKILRRNRIPAMMLNMNLAFHHPGMRYLRALSLRRLNALTMFPPSIPMLSCTRAALYPQEQEAICSCIADLDENTVDWVKSVQVMQGAYGIRHWLELGPQEILCGITQENFAGADVTAASHKGKEAEFMRSACAKLYSLGLLDSAAIKKTAHSPIITQTKTRPLPDVNFDKFYTQSVKFNEKAKPALKILASISGKNPEDLKPEQDLRTDLSIRSSRFPYLLQELEKAANRQIPLEALFKITTIQDVLNVFLESGEEIAEERQNVILEHPPHCYRTPPLQQFKIDKNGLIKLLPICRHKKNLLPHENKNILAAIFDSDAMPALMFWLAAAGLKLAIPSYYKSRVEFLEQLNLKINYLSCAGLPEKEEWAEALENYYKNYGAPEYIIFMPPAVTTITERLSEEWLAIEKITKNFIRAVATEAHSSFILRFNVPHSESQTNSLSLFEEIKATLDALWTCRIFFVDTNLQTPEESSLCASSVLADTLNKKEEGTLVWSMAPETRISNSPVWTDEFSRICQPIYQDQRDWRAYSCHAQFSSFESCNIFHFDNFLQDYSGGKKIFHNLPGKISYGEILNAQIEAVSSIYPWLSCVGVSDLTFYELPLLSAGITRELKSDLIIQPWMQQEKIPTLMMYADLFAKSITTNGRITGKWDKILKSTPLLATETSQPQPLWDKDELNLFRQKMELHTELASFSFLDKQQYSIKLYKLETEIEKANLPEWQIDCAFTGSIAIMIKWQYKYFADILDVIIAAIWGFLAKDLRAINYECQWRLSSIGYVRFNHKVKDSKNPSEFKAYLSRSWQTADVFRFDAQADTLEDDSILTVHAIEFERIVLK